MGTVNCGLLLLWRTGYVLYCKAMFVAAIRHSMKAIQGKLCGECVEL